MVIRLEHFVSHLKLFSGLDVGSGPEEFVRIGMREGCVIWRIRECIYDFADAALGCRNDGILNRGSIIRIQKAMRRQTLPLISSLTPF